MPASSKSAGFHYTRPLNARRWSDMKVISFDLHRHTVLGQSKSAGGPKGNRLTLLS